MEKEQVTITFHNVHYEVEQKLYSYPCAATEKKEILCGLRCVIV